MSFPSDFLTLVTAGQDPAQPQGLRSRGQVTPPTHQVWPRLSWKRLLLLLWEKPRWAPLPSPAPPSLRPLPGPLPAIPLGPRGVSLGVHHATPPSCRMLKKIIIILFPLGIFHSWSLSKLIFIRFHLEEINLIPNLIQRVRGPQNQRIPLFWYWGSNSQPGSSQRVVRPELHLHPKE